MSDRDAYTVAEFCARHGFSKRFLYAEWSQGRGPRFMLIGDRRFISREAGADWRREREAEATVVALAARQLPRGLASAAAALRAKRLC